MIYANYTARELRDLIKRSKASGRADWWLGMAYQLLAELERTTAARRTT